MKKLTMLMIVLVLLVFLVGCGTTCPEIPEYECPDCICPTCPDCICPDIPGCECNCPECEECPELEVVQNSGQNAINKGLGHPYINWTIDGLCIEFEFVNPTKWEFVFDYRVDGEEGESHEYSDIVINPGGELAGELIGLKYNWVVMVGVGTVTVQVCAEEEVWVGLRVGAENDWYLDWIKFEKKICE